MRFHIRTFGCQMNVADTERMTALLTDSGLEATESADQADLIVLNGCSVREKAVHKAISALGRFGALKGEAATGRKPLIGVGGCVGQLEKDQLFKRAPYLDFVFGPDAIDQLPEIVERARAGERRQLHTEFDRSREYSTATRIDRPKAQAFVNIMKGCDKFCTYCIVPFTRGREKSRRIDEVLDDLAALVSRGIREVTLLGQNVNSFGKGNPNAAAREPRELSNRIGKVGPRDGEENFPQLLRAIEADPRLERLKRVRYTSSHPLDFSDELIQCYADLRKLCAQLHLPVQSGSDRVLEKMGRHHRIADYVAQMDRLRELRPDVGLSTDLIVGFPGETEEDFGATLALLDRVGYDNVYAFAYSPRPGTRAAKLDDDVPAEVKNDRLNRLLAHQMKIAEERYRARIGQEFDILVEGQARHDRVAPGERVWTGRTECNRIVNFASRAPRDFTGQFLRVAIRDATALALTGEPVGA